MPTDPLPEWFAKKFNLTSADMFPEKQRPHGTVSGAAGGHHDAGDYSKCASLSELPLTTDWPMPDV